jgi:hypothetical protein
LAHRAQQIPGDRQLTSTAARVIIALACAVDLAAVGGWAYPLAPGPVIIEADARHPVFVGSVTIDLTRRVRRIGLLVAASRAAQHSTPEEGTDALVRIARRAVPEATIVPWPVPGPSYVPPIGGPSNPSSLPNVRIDLRPGANDRDVRETISRFMEAINVLDPSDPAAEAQVIGMQYTTADCADVDAALQIRAKARIRQLADALGEPAMTDISLHRLRQPLQLDGPVNRESACTNSHSTFTEPWAPAPASASFWTSRNLEFIQPMRFHRNAGALPISIVPAGASMPPGPIHVHLRTQGTLLSVEGVASFRSQRTGTFYEYRGPKGPRFAKDITIPHLDDIRRRVRALDIADSAIVTQLDPQGSAWYVAVRSPASERSEAIAAAIAGPRESEQDAVTTTAIGDACGEEKAALERAVDNASSRARRIARGLNATLEPQPVFVAIEYGIDGADCVRRDRFMSLPAAGRRHGSGSLRDAPSDGSEVGVVASFALAHPTFEGSVRAQTASDGPSSLVARFNDVPPPIDYSDVTAFGQAQVEKRLRPRHVRLEMLLSSDHHHGFRPIDAGVGALLAAKLGASDTQYRASIQSSPLGFGAGTPSPTALLFAADIPYRGSTTLDAANAALATALRFGYGQFSIMPESDTCATVADALALDAIRAAARRVPAAARRGRLVAIDLRGPFAVDGRCEPAPRGVAAWAIRDLRIPDVRITAYARVSYAR